MFTRTWVRLWYELQTEGFSESSAYRQRYSFTGCCRVQVVSAAGPVLKASLFRRLRYPSVPFCIIDYSRVTCELVHVTFHLKARQSLCHINHLTIHVLLF